MTAPLPTDDLPLRPDFLADAETAVWRERAWDCLPGLRLCLMVLGERCTRPDDREAVADALDSLRGVFAALRDVGTDDPRAADDPDGSRTVVTLCDVLPD